MKNTESNRNVYNWSVDITNQFYVKKNPDNQTYLMVS